MNKKNIKRIRKIGDVAGTVFMFSIISYLILAPSIIILSVLNIILFDNYVYLLILNLVIILISFPIFINFYRYCPKRKTIDLYDYYDI